ncbi:hypothetical protein MATL_G00025850 [Megalops atlanticus]|uniref:CCHC-type domain-containing protein n=1 Tax=Megalops atlanticus TaxID=7932 RepID=A0A9D3TCI8_MEGAT|nr:hypothetical protein MATL_G00025850 [Megalops atlanticus]
MIQTSNHLAALARLEPRLVPLVLAFRYWAKLCHIDCQAEGDIPSYSFSLMVIFFLQQRKQPIPPVYLGYWIEGFDLKHVDEYRLNGVEMDIFVGWEHRPRISREGREEEGDSEEEEEDGEAGLSKEDCGGLHGNFVDLLLSEQEGSPADRALARLPQGEHAGSPQEGLASEERPFPSTSPLSQNGLLESEEEEMEIKPEDLYYVFDRMIFTGGKPPTVVCSICKRDGHLKDECPEDFKKIELKPLPPMTEHFREILDGLCGLCYNELSLLPLEQQKRADFRRKLNCKEIIEGLAKILKKHTGLRNILPITTAKVPIIKFEHRQSGLEGDISLYNTLIFDGKNIPQRMVDGWNAFFFDDIDGLRKRLPELGQNHESVGELWLGLLRFYTEEFDFKDHVISIRQKKRLTTFEKQWTSKCIAIEDPFDLNHNLGAGDYFFDSKVLTDGELAPNDRCCRVCGKIGHYLRDCPKKRRVKRKENEKDKDLKEDERSHGRGAASCVGMQVTSAVTALITAILGRGTLQIQMVHAMVTSQSIPIPQTGLEAQNQHRRTRQPSECYETWQTPPYSPQATPFSQGSSQASSSPQASQAKSTGPPKQPPHPQVQLPLFGFPHSALGQCHPGLSVLGLLLSRLKIPLCTAPGNGKGGSSPSNPSPMNLNDPSIIFAQPTGRPLGVTGGALAQPPGPRSTGGEWHSEEVRFVVTKV